MGVKNKKAQGMLEYALLIAIIVAVIVVMQIYVKRALQGKFKQTADQMGEQFTTSQNYTIETSSVSARRETTARDPANKNWTESKIMTDAEAGKADFSKVPDKQLTYKGYEITTTDFVTATAGAKAKGASTHGFFDSGVLKNQTLSGD